MQQTAAHGGAVAGFAVTGVSYDTGGVVLIPCIMRTVCGLNMCYNSRVASCIRTSMCSTCFMAACGLLPGSSGMHWTQAFTCLGHAMLQRLVEASQKLHRQLTLSCCAVPPSELNTNFAAEVVERVPKGEAGWHRSHTCRRCKWSLDTLKDRLGFRVQHLGTVSQLYDSI
jgi:hypothetical protein